MTLTVLHKRNAKTGQPYRETLEHGYDPQQTIDWWMGQRLNGIDSWARNEARDATVYADMYACGFLPRHYPVPATL